MPEQNREKAIPSTPHGSLPPLFSQRYTVSNYTQPLYHDSVPSKEYSPHKYIALVYKHLGLPRLSKVLVWAFYLKFKFEHGTSILRMGLINQVNPNYIWSDSKIGHIIPTCIQCESTQPDLHDQCGSAYLSKPNLQNRCQVQHISNNKAIFKFVCKWKHG